MFKGASLLCIAFSFLSMTTQAWSQKESAPNALRILVAGEPSVSRSIIEAMRRINAKYDLKFEFVDGSDAQHDLKLIVSGGSGSLHGCSECCSGRFYYNSIVAFTPDGKLLFTVSQDSGHTLNAAVVDAATIAIRNIYLQSTLLQKQSPFNSGAHQETVKPIVPTGALEATAQALPAEPGVYYKAGVDWIRITTSSWKADMKGVFSPRFVNVYAGAHAKAQVAELKPEFYVRGFPVSEQDIRILRLETKKDQREAQIQSFNKLRLKANDVHAVTVTRISNGVHKITPASELRSGEYTLILYISDYISASTPSDYEFGITSSKQ